MTTQKIVIGVIIAFVIIGIIIWIANKINNSKKVSTNSGTDSNSSTSTGTTIIRRDTFQVPTNGNPSTQRLNVINTDRVMNGGVPTGGQRVGQVGKSN